MDVALDHLLGQDKVNVKDNHKTMVTTIEQEDEAAGCTAQAGPGGAAGGQ